MRICGLSDLHITEDHRFDDQRQAFTAWADAAIALRPDLFLFGGDFLGHVPGKSTAAERLFLAQLVSRCAEVAPVVACSGNHCKPQDVQLLANLGGDWPIRVVTELTAPSDFAFDVSTPSGIAHLYVLPWPTKRHLLAGEDAPRGVSEGNAAVQEALGGILTMWAARVRRTRLRAPSEPHIGLAHLSVAGSVTSGGEVLSGHDIEVSRAQLESVGVDYGWLGHLHGDQAAGERWAYPGSLTRNDFGEVEPKTWRVVDLGAPGPDGRLALSVERRPSLCRSFVTLTYRWSADTDDGAPRWTVHPSRVELAACAGAEVRMRLSVPEAWAPSCPWAEAVAVVRQAGAHRIAEERKTEPTLRVRAPGVAAALTDAARLAAYWEVIASPPAVPERAGALSVLEELRTCDDETIARADL
jgi:DNA repair exonuclease SbcCD nuclease subunit